ncbi:hypothetical protein D9M72_564050 [compost metagenome]
MRPLNDRQARQYSGPSPPSARCEHAQIRAARVVAQKSAQLARSGPNGLAHGGPASLSPSREIGREAHSAPRLSLSRHIR